MTRINTNVSSLIAQNTLARNNVDLQTSLTRLSTGLRINVGKDDPAGLIASEALRSDIVSSQKAVNNSERANQIIATADSALGQVSSLLNDIRGLVTEAANTGALSDEQIAANQLQVDSSLEAINRIAQTTSFQGRRLLDGSLGFLTSGSTPTVRELNIDHANLGTSGTVAVSVDITSAATQAALTATVSGSSSAGTKATGTLTFASETSGAQPTINNITFGSGATLALTSATNADQTISSVVLTQNATESATFSGGTLTINANFTAGRTATQIATLISGDLASDFATVTGNGTTIAYTPAQPTINDITFSGGGTLSLTSATNADQTITDVVFVDNATEGATFSGGTLTVTADFTSGRTAAQLATIITGDLGADFATVTGNGTAVAAAEDSNEAVVKSQTGGPVTSDGDSEAVVKSQTGTAGTSGAETITLTTAAASADTRSIIVHEAASVGATPTVAYDTNGTDIVVSVDDTSTTSLTAIRDAINTFATSKSLGITAAVGTGFTGNGVFTPSAQSSDVTGALSGGAAATTVGLQADIVLELSGLTGREVFNFESGSTGAQIANAVNLVSDSTGITAAFASGTLTFTSSAYGSAALVEAKVLNEGSGGTFGSSLSATRDNGTDIVATVNGVGANGVGNSLSINTSTLNVSLTVDDGSSTDVSFNITGGGAVFQLGPDVVSNQQARIGIQSVNTARLGGADGRLYELASGGAKALNADTVGAAKVVDEAINSVTQLRGRLGSFQRTILDTNIASLNDTISNLTDAESKIRDADFAAETAKLTRAQILVQSGTAVLQIANKNPQNVLALLQ